MKKEADSEKTVQFRKNRIKSGIVTENFKKICVAMPFVLRYDILNDSIMGDCYGFHKGISQLCARPVERAE